MQATLWIENPTAHIDGKPDRFGWDDRDDITAARHKGNANSVEAHRIVEPAKASQKGRILEVLRPLWPEGKTGLELTAETGINRASMAARLSELKADGWIEEKGTKPTPAGVQEAICVAVKGAGSW